MPNSSPSHPAMALDASPSRSRRRVLLSWVLLCAAPAFLVPGWERRRYGMVWYSLLKSIPRRRNSRSAQSRLCDHCSQEMAVMIWPHKMKLRCKDIHPKWAKIVEYDLGYMIYGIRHYMVVRIATSYKMCEPSFQAWFKAWGWKTTLNRCLHGAVDESW